VIDNYVEKPEVNDPAMDIAYPMYNKETGEFFWMIVNYQMTVANYILDIKNMEHEIAALREESVALRAENESLREVTDALLMESLESEVV
jgi:regulator of replication initiation timing